VPQPQDADTELASTCGNQQYDTQTEHTYATRLASQTCAQTMGRGDENWQNNRQMGVHLLQHLVGLPLRPNHGAQGGRLGLRRQHLITVTPLAERTCGVQLVGPDLYFKFETQRQGQRKKKGNYIWWLCWVPPPPPQVDVARLRKEVAPQQNALRRCSALRRCRPLPRKRPEKSATKRGGY